MEISDKFNKDDIEKAGDLKDLDNQNYDGPRPTLKLRIFYSLYTFPDKVMDVITRFIHWYGGPGPEGMGMHA